jgi:hypothetical protein
MSITSLPHFVIRVLNSIGLLVDQNGSGVFFVLWKKMAKSDQCIRLPKGPEKQEL